ncbi:Cro/Cl family transcriptional regulator [Burkholderia diffusa]|uniref:Cro/Cl family transcriptional regulator n=1 Tax=Burkholderia diffusa TaxID=488732 RepID=A0AAW3PF56_9BURK|nr:CS1 type fimbrial major subunit [Burkholderia diffusa]AOI59582.1 Cro/Cl family transcriptional regulator [Burkholderia diffusa]KVC43052.1 Cro/Cl family transcriptional regulator [Burkholderia diffusa]KVM91879.1 Cro/Cl family transcriptional regulator [Burkholderia diffusa]KWF32235.1 Cro/Cl family transcriptional regulator [Burkholderia diffusa]KWF34730.1 Cro/Cl family transcriptional regulator [Burkholderia diffusa]
MMIKYIPVIAMSMLSLSAMAVQKDITVVADVDPTLELLQPDGSALPSTLRLSYVPGSGLQKQSVQTKIFSNDASRDLQVRLAVEPQLVSVTNTSAEPIPLSVAYGGKELNVTPITIKASDVFTDASATSTTNMPLEIKPSKASVITTAGSYQGVVSIVLTQAAKAVAPPSK